MIQRRGLKEQIILTPEMGVAKEMGDEEGAIPSRYTTP